MSQKLSAIKYIRNNKRRTSVLIVSLSLCFVLTYLTDFILSTSIETFKPLLQETTIKIQYAAIAGSSFGIDVENLPTEEIHSIYSQKKEELIASLKENDKIIDVYESKILYCRLKSIIGMWYYELPLVEKDKIPTLLEHFDAKLIEGRLPENPGEIILDKDSMNNNDYKLNDYFDEENCGEYYKIVGVISCSTYFGCGIPNEAYYSDILITILSNDIEDMSAELIKLGVNVRKNYDTIVDYTTGTSDLDEISSDIETSTSYVYVGINILLFIALLIVYSLYLRDRRDEWCLYSSIGYSRKTIHTSILKELLITFGIALLIGSFIICLSEGLLYKLMFEPLGLKCKFFLPQTIIEILCSYVLLFGTLQIPIRIALYKIRTIDAIDDDLY